MDLPKTIAGVTYKTFYVSISNSDDKLSQADWASFVHELRMLPSRIVLLKPVKNINVHGFWHSLPDQPWQNACLCIAIGYEDERILADIGLMLREMARVWRQESIMFYEVTEMRIYSDNGSAD